MTALAIVVADIDEHRLLRERSLAALIREILPGDEVIWVSSYGPWPAVAAIHPQHAPAAASRGEFYRLGWQATTAPLIAFTDSLTELGIGWRAAAVGALLAGASVVGGPVHPEVTRSRRSMAGFLLEYGPHAVAPFTSASGDVSANNVAYRREALAAVARGTEPIWKSVLNRKLAARGNAPVIAADMEVTSMKHYTLGDIAIARSRHGRLYGVQQSVGWTRQQRVTRAASCAVLPALSFARLLARTRRDTDLRASMVTSAPLVLVGLAAWSIGEASGYLSGATGPHGVR